MLRVVAWRSWERGTFGRALRRRLVAITLLALFVAPLSLPAQAQEEAAALVSRAHFLEEAVSFLYGDLQQSYAVPLTGVPERIQQAVGLALAAQAIPEWERTSDWRSPVTRGQALQVLFRLAEVELEYGGRTGYRDVPKGVPTSVVKQSEVLRLLPPLAPHTFGWHRALKTGELQHLLQAIAEHLSLPLSPPSPEASSLGRTPSPLLTPSQRSSKFLRGAQPVRIRGREERNRTGRQEPLRVEVRIESPGGFAEDLPRQELLSAIWGLVREKFLHFDKVDEGEVGYLLAEELLKTLKDPYASFLRPKPAESFQQHLQGEISGIGAQVEAHPLGGVRVVSPLTGSPAMAAGVRPNDRITHVDGESILDLNLQEAVERIRGPAGSKVEIMIEREGATLKITIVRAKIALPELELSLQDGVAVVKLFQFGERTIRELGSLLSEALRGEPIGFVLDLRNNPGGLLDAAIDVLGHFLPQGSVVAQIKARREVSEERVTHSQPTVPVELPLVVLVNRGSASASEIVAGALQDHERATVVGAQTFGKGSVQEVMQFATHESVKFTIAEWLTPHGRSIEGVGITPDVLLEELPAGRDELLLEALRIVQAKAWMR
jgi:carboxyl-terminal processing protease